MILSQIYTTSIVLLPTLWCWYVRLLCGTCKVPLTLLQNFLHVLYHLTANPKYASPMRKEIEAEISKEGWSKASLDKMHKLDSFVKESLRISPAMSGLFAIPNVP